MNDILKRIGIGLLAVVVGLITVLNYIPTYTAAKVEFEESVDTGYYYGDGNRIYFQKIGGENGFCIEWDKEVITVDGYKEVSHIPEISKTTEDRIILAAHFGYNKQKNTAADFAATQVYIWKILFEAQKKQTYLLTQSTNIPDFSNKIKDIENEIAKFEKYKDLKVSFHNVNKTLKPGESITLIDENKLLSERKFKVLNTPNGVTASISGDKLTIKATSTAASGTVLIQIPDINIISDNRYFYHPSSQDVSLIGYDDPMSALINITVEKEGKIKVVKVDDESKPVEGATFKFYNTKTDAKENKNAVASVTTNSKGIATTKELEAKKYFVKETSVGDQYKLSSSIEEVTVEPGKTIEYHKTNERRIIYLGKKDEDGNWIPKTKFKLYADIDGKVKLGEYTTESNGKVSVRDKWGYEQYFVQEVEAPHHLVLNNSIQKIQMNGAHNNASFTQENDYRELTIGKKDEEGNWVPETKFELYSDKYMKNKLITLTTKSNGKVTIKDEWGYDIYYLKEVEVNKNLTISKDLIEIKMNINKDTYYEVENDYREIQLLKTSNSGKVIKNVEFTLYEDSACTKALGTYKTNSKGKIVIEDKWGKDTYWIKETKTPSQFIPKTKAKKITMDDNENYIFEDDDWVNEQTYIEIKKIDESGNTVEGVTFKIATDKEMKNVVGTYTTDKNGYINVKLKPDDYWVQEISAPEHLEIDSTPRKYELEKNSYISKTWENKYRILTIGKKDTKGNWVPNTTFKIFADEDCEQLLGTYTTNSKGKVVFKNKWGLKKYYIKESAVPKNLILDTSKHEVVFNEKNEYSWTNTNDFRKIKIVKLDKDSRKPIANVKFQLATDSKMNNVLGEYTTDSNGEIVVDDVWAESYYYIKEIEAPNNYILDKGVKRIKPMNNTTYTHYHYNEHAYIKIIKTDEDGDFVRNVEFKIATDQEMTNLVGTYTTDKNGIIKVKVKPGDYWVQEISAPSHLKVDSTPYHIEVKDNSFKKYECENKFLREPLRIIKKDAAGNRVEGVTFKISTRSDMSNGVEYVTDANGVIKRNLLPGTYYVQEVKTLPYLIPDTRIEHITITETRGATVTYYNAPTKITLKKVDEDKNPVADVVFDIYSDEELNTKVGTYTTDVNGIITLEYMLPGTYYIQEVKAPGKYTINPEIKSVTLEEHSTAEIEYENTYRKLTVTKVDEGGNKIAGMVFELYRDERLTQKVDTYTTGEDGTVVIENIDSGTYFLKEIAVPSNLQLSNEIHEITLLDNEDASYTVQNDFTWINLKKVDELGNTVPGVTFKLSQNADMSEPLGEYTTNLIGEIVIENLYGGTYYVQEVAVPNHIVLDSTIREVVLENNKTTTIEITNKLKRSSISVQKVDADNPENKLVGVEFALSNEEDMSNILLSTFTNEEGIATFNELLPGTYYVQEVKSIDGYVLNETIHEVIVEDYDTTYPIVIENEPTEMEFSKVSITDKEELPGATIQVIDKATNKVVEEWVSTDKPHIIKGLVEGKEYIMKETIAPDGFLVAEEIVFVAGHNEKVMMYDEPIEMEFSKQDITTSKELPGATIQVIDKATNKVVEEWVSTDEPHIIKCLVEGKEYIMKEITAPDGYLVAEEIVFVAGHNEKVVMYDEPIEMEFSKQDITTSKELPGATIQVIDQATNKVVEEWISTDEPHIIKGLVEGKEYIMKETTAPDGFLVAEEIVFVAEHGSKITMKDEPTKMEFSKVGITGKDELPGATIQVINKATNEVVEEWVSTDEPHIIKGLVEGKEYIMKETTAPDGYLVAEEIVFVAGHKDKITMKDEPIEMEFSKQDITTSKELPGATIQVINKATNEVVEEWVSTDKPHVIKGLVENKEYIMRETIAPYGYSIAEEIVFVAGHKDKITMKDEPIYSYIDVQKVDKRNEKNILKVCEFTLYADYECTKEITTVSANKSTGIARFDDLRYGTYYFKETAAPKGYKLSDEVKTVVIDDKWVAGDNKLRTIKYYNVPSGTTGGGADSGDDTNIMLWILTLMTCVSSLLLINLKGRKKEN